MLPLFFSENQFIESVPVTDRAFHYGDGLFETLAVENNKPQFLQAHLERLALGCGRLQIPSINLELIATDVQNFLQKAPQEKAVLKIIVTRGSGGRGYAVPAEQKPRIIFCLYPWPEEYAKYTVSGVQVFLCKTKLAYNASLARIKHLNRLEQVLARLEFNAADYQEGLMFSENSLLIEGTMSNVFIFKGKNLLTPKLDFCGVAGIMRKSILALAPKLGFNCEEINMTQEMLLSVDEVFLCNSIIKIWPVVGIMEQRFPLGENTRKIMNIFEKDFHFKARRAIYV